MSTDFQRQRVRLSGQTFNDEHLSGLDLRGAVADGSLWRRCRFEHVRLSGAHFGRATFEDCEFTGCELQQAVLVSRIHRSTFESCDLDQARLQGADVQDSAFFSCRAELSSWRNATVERTRLDVNFRGADLTLAVSEAVDWSGSSFWSASVPLNCAFLTGNTFDERQLEMFIALLLMAKIPPRMRPALESVVSPRRRRVVERLVGNGNGCAAPDFSSKDPFESEESGSTPS